MNQVAKTIVILSTLDTYGKEIDFVKERIEQRGHKTIVIDISMRGEPLLPADVTCDEIAEAGGTTIEEIRASDKRQEINRIMIKGAIEKVKQLYSAGAFDGIIAIGGATIAFIGTSVMKTLPFGLPKFVVSSSGGVSSLVGNYFGGKDITLMDSVVDIGALNDLVKSVLIQAAGAICGMVESSPGPALTITPQRPLIALTLLGYCERCAQYVMQHLEQRGYQVVPFHAHGIGDRAMEEMIDQGLFTAVIDLCPGAIMDELFGGIRVCGPHRLEAAGERGIPQILAPSGLEFIAFSPPEYKPQYKSRKSCQVDDLRLSIRSSPDELVAAARVIATKLNKARGPVKFLIPLRGWSDVDGPGRALDEPQSNRAFTDELRRCLKPEIEIREIDAWLEDPDFALAVVTAFDEIAGC